MKYILFLLAGILFLSCNNEKDRPVIFSPNNLRTQYFEINPSRDTMLRGLRGGTIFFEKQSFDGTGPVQIELKEAYAPAEILLAGLTTESNGRLLESGGMVYVNARRNGKELKLNRPVMVSLPSNYTRPEMQIFKGEIQPDSSINWVEPVPVDTAINPPSNRTGKRILETTCSPCHSLFKDGTGPALAFVEERIPDRALLRDFITNPAKTMAQHKYFACLKTQFGSMMTSFPALGNNIDSVLDYIKNESAKRPDLRRESAVKGLSDTMAIAACLSCGADTIYIDTTNTMSYDDNVVSDVKNVDRLERQLRAGFTDVIRTQGRYNFKIETLGWYNVDALVDGLEGSTGVDLFVKVNSDLPDTDTSIVYVFTPARKLLTVGNYHEEDDLFYFEKYQRQIPLYLNDEAVALAITSSKEKIYYGISGFRVSRKQTIAVTMKEISEEALRAAFIDLKLDGINLDVITKKRSIVPKTCD